MVEAAHQQTCVSSCCRTNRASCGWHVVLHRAIRFCGRADFVTYIRDRSHVTTCCTIGEPCRLGPGCVVNAVHLDRDCFSSETSSSIDYCIYTASVHRE